MKRKGMVLLAKREVASARAYAEELARVQGEWYGRARRYHDEGMDLCMAEGPSGYDLVVGLVRSKVIWSVTLEWKPTGVCVFRIYVDAVLTNKG